MEQVVSFDMRIFSATQLTLHILYSYDRVYAASEKLHLHESAQAGHTCHSVRVSTLGRYFEKVSCSLADLHQKPWPY